MTRTARTFRVFVSSTFSDLKEERNALHKEVFPKLRELCAKHDCRFQTIDLRWGVPEEAGLDQQTMSICLDEVKRSQRVSPRPNFIVILGDRYGWRPLPAEIDVQEFDQIVRCRTEFHPLLKAWYVRDDNAVPPVYCLQPRHKEFADYHIWEEKVERPLRVLLREAITQIRLSGRPLLKYTTSATEQEIEAGAMSVRDANEHVTCFFRSIRNLPQDLRAKDYLDFDDKGAVDTDAQNLLEGLKARLRQHLSGRIHDYVAEWTEEGMTTHHIHPLCEDVLSALSDVIKQEIVRLERIDTLDKEIIDHDVFGNQRAKTFVGRSEPLQAIADYISENTKYPLVVCGDSGSGKSALMARAASLIRARFPAYHVVVRFIGATPGSSNIRALLESVCRQIAQLYGVDETTVPSDYRELILKFRECLALSSADTPVVVFLDALDQLPEREQKQSLLWLAAQLPIHARLIVTTIPGNHISSLEKKLPKGNIVRLNPMELTEASQLLDLWLEMDGRTLQPGQKSQVLNTFAACPLPLYLKLAFEEARHWKSYTMCAPLRADIPGIIRDLFARLSLDSHHGLTLVSRSLSYLVAARNGLSEDELLDVLSRDKTVFEDFKRRAKHEPPEERLPAIVWSRLYFDLEPYLTERSGDGTTLLGFFHRQLKQVVIDDYLTDKEKLMRHRSLADYFATMPLCDSSKTAYSIRKLSELPYQQTSGEMWEELHSILTDFEFVEAKCTYVAVTVSGKRGESRPGYGGVYELQQDYRLALQRLSEALQQKTS